MYGLISTITAAANQRSELIRILLHGTSAMPGCLSYEVAEDNEDPDLIWITEVWTDEASHEASLQLPSVQGDDGAHFAAEVVDESFRGKNRVQQQRAVYAALKGKMDGPNGELHALALTTRAPDA